MMNLLHQGGKPADPGIRHSGNPAPVYINTFTMKKEKKGEKKNPKRDKLFISINIKRKLQNTVWCHPAVVTESSCYGFWQNAVVLNIRATELSGMCRTG